VTALVGRSEVTSSKTRCGAEFSPNSPGSWRSTSLSPFTDKAIEVPETWADRHFQYSFGTHFESGIGVTPEELVPAAEADNEHFDGKTTE